MKDNISMFPDEEARAHAINEVYSENTEVLAKHFAHLLNSTESSRYSYTETFKEATRLATTDEYRDHFANAYVNAVAGMYALSKANRCHDYKTAHRVFEEAFDDALSSAIEEYEVASKTKLY